MIIINTAISYIIPVILAGILGYIIKIYKDSKAMRQAMVSLLRSQIVGKCEKCLDQGYLPDSVRNCLEDLFNQYTVLGGNHGVSKLVDQTFLLPPKKKRSKKNEKVME